MTTFSLFAALFACHTIVWEVHGHSLEAANKETPRLTATHSVVQMTTADGVALEMEGYPGGPSVVLLNMIPPRSLVDYADWAGQNQIPVPALLGFMTGGRSTENNLAMSEVKGFPA
ncbi:MAG: hypothetical protein GWP91_01505, partial [Rhodobacterales bacterium]|nr:hypothetical protein [Rhodobacterales bacterium]